MPDQQSVTAEKPAKKQWGRWLLVALAVILADQFTKWLILSSFAEGERLPVIDGLFDLTLWYNPGAAFSFLAAAAGWQRWFFTVVGICAAFLLFHMIRQSSELKLFSFGLSLIMGGALGNVIDRLIHGKVVDFLLFYQNQSAFPAFNVADSAITVGAICLISDELLRWYRSRQAAAGSTTSD